MLLVFITINCTVSVCQYWTQTAVIQFVIAILKVHCSYAQFIITRSRLRGAGIYMRIGMPHWICREVSAPVGVCCLMSLPPLLNSGLWLLQNQTGSVRRFLEFETTTKNPGNHVETFAGVLAVKLDMGIWCTKHVTAMLNLWSWFVVKIWTDGWIKIWKFTAVLVYLIWIFVFYSSIFRKVRLYTREAKLFCASKRSAHVNKCEFEHLPNIESHFLF